MTEDVILEAARKRFARFGIAKTTMNEIARDIGTSKASLYYYFPDKEHLVIAVVGQDLARFEQLVTSMINRPTRAAHKLKKYVAIRTGFFRELLTLAKIEHVGQSDIFNPVFNDLKTTLYRKELELVRAILNIGVRQGEFAKIRLDNYAELFVSGLIGLRSAGLVFNPLSPAQPSENLESQTQLFVEVFLKAIRR